LSLDASFILGTFSFFEILDSESPARGASPCGRARPLVRHFREGSCALERAAALEQTVNLTGKLSAANTIFLQSPVRVRILD